MKKRREMIGDIKKHHVLQKPTRLSDVLASDFDDLETAWQDEKSRRLSVREWRRFRQQSI